MSEEVRNDYLILNKPQLLAILGHCLKTPSFLRNCSKSLTKDHLQDIMIAEMYDYVIGYYKKYDKAPTIHEADAWIGSKYTDLLSVQKYRQLLYEAVDLQCKNFPVESLSDQISGWLRTIVMRNVFVKGGALFNKNNYTEASRVIFDMQSKLRDAQFDDDERVDLTDMENVITNVVVNREKACTLGHPEFDELIMTGAKIDKRDPKYDETKLEGQTRGSLLPGEITVLMGPINSGKTTALSTVTISNIMIGKKVCYVGCEDPKDKMSLKMMQTFSGMNLEKLSQTKSPEYVDMNGKWVNISSDRLYYFEWIKPGKMYIEDVIDLIENAQDKAKQGPDGKGFDLVIVDYPGVLMSRNFRGKETWDEKRHIYAQLRLLAGKYGFHVLAPIQTNREGFKLNTTAERLLDMGDVAQGFGILADADNVITINRSAEDHAGYRVKFYVAKTRSGEAKRAFVSEVRYDLGRTHGVGYGFAVINPHELKDIGSEEFLANRLKRIKTADIAALRNANSVAYSQAPPMDKAVEKAGQLASTPIVPTPATVVPSGSWDIPIQPGDPNYPLKPK